MRWRCCFQGLPRWFRAKESACCAAGAGSSQVEKIPWRSKWQPMCPCLGNPEGERSLAVPQSRVPESDTTEHARCFKVYCLSILRDQAEAPHITFQGNKASRRIPGPAPSPATSPFSGVVSGFHFRPSFLPGTLITQPCTILTV